MANKGDILFTVSYQIFTLIVVSALTFISYPASVRIKGYMSDFRDVEIEADGKIRKLSLTPLENIWSDFAQSLYIGHNENGEQVIERKNIPKDITVYHDAKRGAVLSLNNGELHGILNSENTLLCDNDNCSMIKSIEDSWDEIDYDFASEDFFARSYSYLMQYNNIPNRKTSNNYTIEIAVIVDSTLANIIGDDSKIYEYLTIFWNRVQKSFQTIKRQTIKISLSGSIIFRNSSAESFITQNTRKDGFLRSEVIFDLGKWVFQNLPILPDHDIIYLQTGKNISSGDETKVTGRSVVNGVCHKYLFKDKCSDAIAVGEDINAYFRGVMGATHEIGHSLGAEHDPKTDKNSLCHYKLGYIMGRRFYKLPTKKRLFFSKCSINQIEDYLKNDASSCLQTNVFKTKTQGNFNSMLLPGDVWSMTEQCRYSTGDSNAVVYNATTPEDSLCIELICSIKEILYRTGYPALEGSQCPSGKICSKGICVNPSTHSFHLWNNFMHFGNLGPHFQKIKK